MTNSILTRFVAVSLLLVLWPAQSPAKEYVLTVGSEQLRFVPQGEKGYVVKQPKRTAGISVLAGTLFLEEGRVQPIGGLDRHGVWIVENEGPSGRNEDTIRSLRASGQVAYAAPLFSSGGETVAIIPEIVVRVKPGVEMEQVQTLCKSAGCAIKKRMEFTTQEYLLEVLGPDAEAVFAAAEKLSQAPEVEWACPNTASRVRLAGQAVSGGNRLYAQDSAQGTIAGSATSGVIPNDPYFPNQWHLHNTGQSGGTPGVDIRAPEAWEITTGDPNIVIAVIDTGVDSHHPDLVNNLVPGYDFYDDDNVPDPGLDDPNDSHGTMCAGLVAAHGNNGLGVTGVTWNCRIMPIRIIAAGRFVTEGDIATAIRWAASNGADILSNSWASDFSTFTLRSALMEVTEAGGMGREGKGCVVLFSVGNAGRNIPWGSPAVYEEVIAVGAADPNDERYGYSNYGPELDLVAPSGYHKGLTPPVVPQWTTDIRGYAGYSIHNSDPNILDYTEAMGGTSAACAIAAGVAALILSVEPNLNNLEFRRVLLSSARDLGELGRDDYYGYGRVDARAAVEMVLNHPPPPRFVDDDAPNDPGPGDPNIGDAYEDGSTEHPFDSIQEAIDVSFPGEIVIVLPGTYTGQGNRDIDFAGKCITVRSMNPNDPEAVSQTVIDCHGNESEPHRGFFFHSGETSSSVVSGFAIVGGYAHTGGGIYCCNNARPMITQCVFRRNSAPRGGAMLNYRANPTVTHCTFTTNTAENGGGMYNQTSFPVIANCTFAKNSGTAGGGGICSVSGSPTLTNCILWGDAPDEVYVSGGTAVITYSNIQGGFSGEGNIDADPLFADPATADYHLKSQAGYWNPGSRTWVKDNVTSPCVDAGDPNSDWTAELWPHGKRINMGAYGGTAQATMSSSTVGNIADLNNDNSVGHADLEMLVEKWLHEEALLAEDLDRNGVVSLSDFCILADEWLWQGP